MSILPQEIVERLKAMCPPKAPKVPKPKAIKVPKPKVPKVPKPKVPLVPLACRCCGIIFTPKGHWQKMCSPTCRARHEHEIRRKLKTPLPIAVCECGKEFVPRNRGHKRCNFFCREHHRRYYSNRRAFGDCANLVYKIRLKLGCKNCDERRPNLLHFHHAFGTKVANISQLVLRRDLEALKLELPKCVLLCANCHTLITHGHGYREADRPVGVTYTTAVAMIAASVGPNGEGLIDPNAY